jgi:hypothetical protein
MFSSPGNRPQRIDASIRPAEGINATILVRAQNGGIKTKQLHSFPARHNEKEIDARGQPD